MSAPLPMIVVHGGSGDGGATVETRGYSRPRREVFTEPLTTLGERFHPSIERGLAQRPFARRSW